VRRLLAGVNWKAFGVLLVAGLLGVVAILPYMMELVGSSIFGRVAAPDVPMPLVLTLALLQNGILLAITILIGLVLSERTGLRMPLIQAWTRGKRASAAQAVVLPALLAGAAVGATLVAIEALVFLRHLPPAMHPLFTIPLWKRLLGSVLYGGITEETGHAPVPRVAGGMALWPMVEDSGRFSDVGGVLDRHRAGCCAFRVGTSPRHVSHHAADDDARLASAGLERDRRHRVWVLVLEARPRSSDDRAHGCPLGDADSRCHHSDKNAVMGTDPREWTFPGFS
jgi:hypothetical protein